MVTAAARASLRSIAVSFSCGVRPPEQIRQPGRRAVALGSLVGTACVEVHHFRCAAAHVMLMNKHSASQGSEIHLCDGRHIHSLEWRFHILVSIERGCTALTCSRIFGPAID
jgi:hypothetical protein